MKEIGLNFLLIGLIFAASLWIRMPHLSRPLTAIDDTPAVQTLITLKIWEKEGGKVSRYNPKTTYPNAGDKYIKTFGLLSDNQGNNYNPTYPQLGYMLPYGIFKAFHIPFTIAKLKDFNLLLHFFCGLWVYLSLFFAIKGAFPTTQYAGVTGVIGFALYTFFPQTLWYQSGGYFPEMLSQFWVGLQLTILTYMVAKQKGKAFHLVLLVLVTAASVYTDWLGIFISTGICLYAIIYLAHSPSGRIWFLTVFSSALAFLAMLWQFSKVHGLKAFLEILPQVFHQKAGIADSSYPVVLENKAAWFKIFAHYTYGFPFLFLMIGLAVVLLVANKKLLPTFSAYKKPIGLLFWGFLLPLIAYQIVFFQSTTSHEYMILKMVYVFVVLVGLFLHPLLEKLSEKTTLSWVNAAAILLFLGSFVGLGIQMYENQYAYHFSPPNTYQALGDAIKKEVQPNEAVFVKASHWKEIPIHLTMYAERNIEPFVSNQDAKFLLETNGLERGVVFVLDSMVNRTLTKRYIYKKL